MKKLSVSIFAVLTLSACSHYSSNDVENRYLVNRNGAPLVVPSPLTRDNISGFYDLPSQDQNARVSVVPPE